MIVLSRKYPHEYVPIVIIVRCLHVVRVVRQYCDSSMADTEVLTVAAVVDVKSNIYKTKN